MRWRTFLEALAGVSLVAAVAFGWSWWSSEGIAVAARVWISDARALTLEDLGQTGDLFGGFNALVAAFAFVGVAVAAYYQVRMYRQQSSQLALAQEEHAQQSFEPLFFNLLSSFRQVRGELEFAVATAQYGGPKALSQLRVGVQREVEERLKKLETHVDGTATDTTLQIYMEFYRRREDSLGPYYRSLYHVFKLVGKTRLKDDKTSGDVAQVQYANIARATLSRSELYLLAVNCLTPLGSEFKPLVERFGLLKHLTDASPQDRRSDWIHIYKRYSPTAFMSHAERLEYWALPPNERKEFWIPKELKDRETAVEADRQSSSPVSNSKVP